MPKKTSFCQLLMGTFVFAIIVSMASCYPNDDLTVSETDLVMTSYYDSVDFSNLNTYYMSDTIYPVRDDTSDKSLIKNNNLIVKTIADNMQAIGYTRLYDTSSVAPDVRISAAAISITNIQVNWWYQYYPGWGWGWGWGWKKSSKGMDYYYGYPGYYPPGWWGYPYYTSYTTGTLLIEMANPSDIRVVDNDTVVPMYWTAAVSGVLGNASSNSDRAVSGVNKAFELSPEIKPNN